MTARRVAVCGNIGSGKSTLCRGLAAVPGFHVLPEDPSENPFLERFYQDMPAFALRSQLRFLVSRHEAYLSAPNAGVLIEDRSIHEDVFVFAQSLFERGIMNADEWLLYSDIARQFLASRGEYDLVIRLHAQVPVLMQRIAQRARKAETSLKASYLEGLQEAYDRLFRGGPPARETWDIDTTEVDFRSPEQSETVIAEVRRRLQLK